MSYTETITDEENILGFGAGSTVEAELYYTIDPVDPGCWRDSNGDGWPATPPCVELEAISILVVRDAEGNAVTLTTEQEDAAVKFVDEDTQLRWESIEERIFDDLANHSEDANWEDARHE